MPSAAPDPSNSDLKRTLDELGKSRIDDLRRTYSSLFSAPPPAAFGPDLLRRSIAQRLQENAYGKLNASTQRELDRVAALLARAPDGRIELPRRIKPGSILVRDWKGTSHRVTVLDQGFGYDDRIFESLSEIARLITGTRWNGPRFFGLRSREAAAPIKVADDKVHRPDRRRRLVLSNTSSRSGAADVR
jgi:hypothetical protein